jgi:hypothetical protein
MFQYFQMGKRLKGGKNEAITMVLILFMLIDQSPSW